MANIKKEMEARNQGIVFAYRIAKEQGIEALEKEIRYRNISGISLNASKQEIEEAGNQVKLHAMRFSILISLVTLYDIFKLSNYQGELFSSEYYKRVQNVANDKVTAAEYIQQVKDTMGIEIILED